MRSLADVAPSARLIVRSRWLRAVAAAALVALVAVCAIADSRVQPVGGSTGGAGFTVAAPGEDPSLRAFRADVERVAAHGGGWVRFGVRAADIVESWGIGTSGTPRLSAAGLEVVDRALGIAQRAGLRVNLLVVDADPSADRPLGSEAFLASMRSYWGQLAHRFAGKVELWQVFNEADGQHLQTHTVVAAAQRPAYLQALAAALRAARESIRGADPRARITTNLSGYPVDPGLPGRWDDALAVIGEPLDTVSVSLYPGLSRGALARLPTLVRGLRQRWGRPVFVGEVGLQTAPGTYSEGEQRRVVATAVRELRGAGVLGVLVYQLRDDAASGAQADDGFGILDSSGAPKSSAAAVYAAVGS